MENDFDETWAKFFTTSGWNWEYTVWDKDAIKVTLKNGLLVNYLLSEIVEICREYLFHGTYFLLKFPQGGSIIATGFLSDAPMSYYIPGNEKVVELCLSDTRITEEAQIGTLRDRPTSDITKACYLGQISCCGISFFSRLQCLCCNRNLRFL